MGHSAYAYALLARVDTCCMGEKEDRARLKEALARVETTRDQLDDRPDPLDYKRWLAFQDRVVLADALNRVEAERDTAQATAFDQFDVTLELRRQIEWLLDRGGGELRQAWRARFTGA